MKGRYKAAFIIPTGAKKILGDDGWEFDSKNRLPGYVKDFLVDDLKLSFLESYLVYVVYANENIKASISHDEEGKIDYVSFQVYGNNMATLSGAFRASLVAKDAELFVPSDSNIEINDRLE